MRKTVLGVALASTFLAAPAFARDDQAYIEVDAGVVMPRDLDVVVGSVPDAAIVDPKMGYDIGGIIRYDFGMFRLEGEVAYKRSSIGDVTLIASPFTTGIIGMPTLA